MKYFDYFPCPWCYHVLSFHSCVLILSHAIPQQWTTIKWSKWTLLCNVWASHGFTVSGLPFQHGPNGGVPERCACLAGLFFAGPSCSAHDDKGSWWSFIVFHFSSLAARKQSANPKKHVKPCKVLLCDGSHFQVALSTVFYCLHLHVLCTHSYFLISEFLLREIWCK